MQRLLGPLVTLALVLAVGVGTAPAAHATRSTDSGVVGLDKRTVPTREQWLADVKAAMVGSRAYVRQRVADQGPDETLAINFDIDNTVLATYYDGGGAIPFMSRFAKFLQRQGVAMLFNTGRDAGQRSSTLAQLKRSGFPVAGLCLRAKGRTLVYGKQRCRDQFAAQGFTLIANVGNNDTDFTGDGYDKAYVLPNYDGALG